MKHSLKIYLRLIEFQIRSQLQYRLSFWLDFFSTAFLNSFMFISLVLVLQRFGQIQGWSIAELAYLFGTAELSFALMDLLFSGFDPDFFAQYTRQGKFDQILIRPLNPTLQIMGSRFVLRRLGRAFEGGLILLISILILNIQWTPIKVILVPLVWFGQVFSMGALFMMGSTITFWTKERIEAVNILTYGGTELMSYPMTIYPGWMQRFFTYIIPFIFLNYYPALYILDKPDPLGFPSAAPFFAPLVGLGMFTASLLFWKFGIDHYQSTGS